MAAHTSQSAAGLFNVAGVSHLGSCEAALRETNEQLARCECEHYDMNGRRCNVVLGTSVHWYLVGPGVRLLSVRVVLLCVGSDVRVQQRRLCRRQGGPETTQRKAAAARLTCTNKVENATDMKASEGLRACLWGAMKPLVKQTSK